VVAHPRLDCQSIILGVPLKTDAGRVSQSLAEIVRTPYAPALVAAYYDPANGFAGAMFDGLDPSGLLSDNPHDHFTVDDIAGTSLLDVRFGPAAVRALLGTGIIQEALAAVPKAIPLWKATERDLETTSQLWDLLLEIDGIGRTRASKLLARKRTATVPIVDSVISAALHLEGDTWRPLAKALSDKQVRHDIESLRPSHVSKKLSTLRLLDVVVWMSHSRSTPAVQVQAQVGAPPARDLPSRHRKGRH
jgi:Family of unknown function (DUF6308)